MGTDSDQNFVTTLRAMPLGPFSTYDFIQQFRLRHPAAWQQLEKDHGIGGKGAGQYRTINTKVAHTLSRMARAGALVALGYRDDAPDTWGNKLIAYWCLAGSVSPANDPGAPRDQEYREGSLLLKHHLVRERHWGLARKKKNAFIAQHGKLFCERCLLDPGEAFGIPIGHAVIEVHHAKTAVGRMGTGHATRLSDLQCICANCHRLVHAEINANDRIETV